MNKKYVDLNEILLALPKNVVKIIEDWPAADVRPVVLCKDCRNDHHCMIQDFMEDYGITPDDQNNFFCGYGEDRNVITNCGADMRRKLD